MKKPTAELIEKLRTQYKDDPEAVEMIQNAEKDIEYIEKKEAAGNYDGQSSISKAQELEAFLHDWY